MQRHVFGSGHRGGHALIPEILETGWGRFATADAGHLKPHRHEGAFELCCIVSGEVEWIAGEASYVLRAGDIYLTKPDELHWGRDSAMHPCELYWLILGSAGCGFVWRGFGEDLANHLDQRLRAFRIHQLRGTTPIHNCFATIFNEHSCRTYQYPEAHLLHEGSARAALQSLLIDLVRVQDSRELAETARNRAHGMPVHTAQLIDALHANAHDPDAIRLACRLAGLDQDTVNRNFVETLGTTITQYWLRERVRLARERLRIESATVTEIATQLGFSSSQHFATVFRRVTGLTPSQFRSTT